MNIHVYIHNTAYIVHQDESSAIFKTAKLCLSAYALRSDQRWNCFKSLYVDISISAKNYDFYRTQNSIFLFI